MNSNNAILSEIFSSFQGEGLYIGRRQFFIRFAGCNLSCQYCDTPIEPMENPLSAEQIINIYRDIDKGKGYHHSICLTGGEPLLQVDFLKSFLPELKKSVDLPIFLETNGTLPDHLSEVIDYIDIISMDFKIPSATGMSSYLKDHQKFLQIASQKEVFVKTIFIKETNVKEIDDVGKGIAAINPEIPLVLQPVTPHGSIKHKPSKEVMFALFNVAHRHLPNVYLIPQTHKILGLQ